MKETFVKSSEEICSEPFRSALTVNPGMTKATRKGGEEKSLPAEKAEKKKKGRKKARAEVVNTERREALDNAEGIMVPSVLPS
ncbi:hypothetical protein KM043_013198 [Ampulex compressa]|nr:hypothetical protein KM043_013198 [Ampulex compressa]